MTRTIKAKDIKPGMTIRWEQGGISHQCPLAGVERFNNNQGIQGETPQGQIALLHGDEDVLVVKESPQPDEPTTFGARVVVNGRRFLRSPEEEGDRWPWLEEIEGIWHDWDYLINVGPVTVIEADPSWTVPDTPEVPDRIDEWPEDDEHLRAHKWRDAVGDVWVSVGDRWGWGDRPWGSHETPVCGPWTRVTDA